MENYLIEIKNAYTKRRLVWIAQTLNVINVVLALVTSDWLSAIAWLAATLWMNSFVMCEHFAKELADQHWDIITKQNEYIETLEKEIERK